jgi:hypothetical protein
MKRVVVLPKELCVVNVGVKDFFHELRNQKVCVVHVEWKPPSEEQKELKDLLDKIL